MSRIARLLPVIMSGAATPWYLSGGVSAANCLAAFKPKGAADYATSKVNLVTPGTNDAADGAAFPTWAAATGWTFVAASTQSLVVGAGAIYALPPATMVCRFVSANATSAFALMTVSNTASLHYSALWLGGNAAGDPVRLLTRGTQGEIVTDTTSGFTALAPYTGAAVFASNASRSAYIDGGSKATNTSTIDQVGLNTTKIGALTNSGGTSGYFGGSIYACAFYSIALSDAQILALHTAMALL